MITDVKYLEAFEDALISSHKPDLLTNLKLCEAMWEEAKALGIFPLKDSYDGVEDDIRLAAVLARLPAANG